MKVEGTVRHNIYFLPSNFCTPVKVAPMARDMPAIP